MEGTGFPDVGFSSGFHSPQMSNQGIYWQRFPSILPNNGGVIKLSLNARSSLTGLSLRMDPSGSATFESVATKILNNRASKSCSTNSCVQSKCHQSRD